MRTIRNIVALISLILYFTSSFGSCPNECSSHGICDKYSRCSCSTNFQGADCSERICPFGAAWSDQATATDSAHNSAECSNRGICDRSTGECSCMNGFTGSACDRLECNLNCNGGGICYSMKDLALKTLNSQSVRYDYSTPWDAMKMKGCVCDGSSSGYDCSLKPCPTGDDPLTTGQVNEVQLLTCSATTGTFTLFYNGKPSKAIPYNANAVTVTQALLSIPAITGVKVTFSLGTTSKVCSVKTNIVSIEFTQQFGPLNPLVPYLSNALSATGGSVVVAADGLTTLRDSKGHTLSSVKGTKEEDTCAKRGLCDLTEGLCTCFDSNGDEYGSSDGYGHAGSRGDCGWVVKPTRSIVSTCPGSPLCSGHGFCDTQSFTCQCSTGWTGGDCSQMSCPQGLSWFSYPTGNNLAHSDYAECSNMGICDPNFGTCTCRDNFYGSACEYMTCGGGLTRPCNGHGKCMSMYELALWSDDNGDSTDYTYGLDPNNYLTWDGHRIHGCLCDKGFSGYDCSLMDCPIGDDPGTYEDHVEVQLLQCVANGGNFSLSFRQASTRILPHSATAVDIQTALSALSTIDRAYVYFLTDVLPPNGTLNYVPPARPMPDGDPRNGAYFHPLVNGSLSFVYDVVQSRPNATFNSSFCRSDGKQVAIVAFEYTHGNLPAIKVDTSLLKDFDNSFGAPGSGQVNVFQDGQSIHGLVSIRGTTETAVCNNRGLCDTSTGTCNCFGDWSSSDGARQGKQGFTGDCGFRNVEQIMTK